MSENELVKYDENYYVCVSNAFVKANQNLSLNESKLLRIMISQVVFNDDELKSYTTTIPELAKFLNVSSKNLYRDIYKMTRTLMQQIIKIDIGKDKWDMFQLFSSCKYREGVLTMRLHDELKPFLIELKKYTQYQIGVIIGMKSNHAIRVYELLKEKRKSDSLIKENESITISIYDLRFATNTVDKYNRIIDFKKNVLDVSAREISCNSEFAIDYEDIKKCRKITDIKFNLYSHTSDKGEEILEKYGCVDWCI